MLCIGRMQAGENGAIKRLIKKCADEIVSKGGVFQNVENLGNRRLAFKFTQKQGTEKRPEYGQYFSFQFIANPKVRSSDSLVRCPSTRSINSHFCLFHLRSFACAILFFLRR